MTLRKKFLLNRDVLPIFSNPKIVLPELSENPILTVIIAHKNGKKYLLDTLNTISNQSFKDYEVVVIDGESTDGSLEILKGIPNLRLLSEKDGGIDDAFSKGLKIARGKYVTHCCVSDGYLDVNWFKNAVEMLERNKWASLVWAFPRVLEKNNTLGRVSYPLLHFLHPPSGVKFFEFWIKSKLPFPEGNYIINREVMKVCFPERPSDVSKYSELAYDPWLMVIIKFHSQGYLSVFHNSIANYGRIHDGSITNEINLGKRDLEILTNYHNLVTEIMENCLSGSTLKSFIDSQGNILEQYSKEKFLPRLHFLEFKLQAIQNALNILNFLDRRIEQVFRILKLIRRV